MNSKKSWSSYFLNQASKPARKIFRDMEKISISLKIFPESPEFPIVSRHSKFFLYQSSTSHSRESTSKLTLKLQLPLARRFFLGTWNFISLFSTLSSCHSWRNIFDQTTKFCSRKMSKENNWKASFDSRLMMWKFLLPCVPPKKRWHCSIRYLLHVFHKSGAWRAP